MRSTSTSTHPRLALAATAAALVLNLWTPAALAGDADGILVVVRTGKLSNSEARVVNQLVAALGDKAPRRGDPLRQAIEKDVSLSAGALDGSSKLQEAITTGRELFIKGNYKDAVTLLQRAVGDLGRRDALLATDGQLRGPHQRGLLYLAHAYLRQNKNNKAIAVITEAIRLFPNTHPPLASYGPDLVALFRQVRNDLRKQPKSTLTLRSKIPGCSVFLNGRYIGVTPTTAKGLLPGRYRVFMQRPSAPGRVHLVDMAGTDRDLVVDHALDSAVVTAGLVGLRYANAATRKKNELDHALAVARSIGATSVTLFGFKRHLGRPVLQGQVLGAATGRTLRSGLIAVSPPPSKSEIQALARFLLSGQRGEGVIIGTAKPVPKPKAKKGTKFMSAKVWRWLTLGLGAALVGSGVALIAIDGSGSCPESNCPNRYETMAPGVALTAAGGAALVTSVVLFFVAANDDDEAKPKTATIVAPWAGRKSAGVTALWHF